MNIEKDPLVSTGYRIPESLLNRINSAKRELGISANAIVIHSIDRGIDSLRESLARKEQPTEATA